MAKLVKKKKKRKLGGFSAGSTGKIESPLRPYGVDKLPPCGNACPNHNPIRKMLMTIQMTRLLRKHFIHFLKKLLSRPYAAEFARIRAKPIVIASKKRVR